MTQEVCKAKYDYAVEQLKGLKKNLEADLKNATARAESYSSIGNITGYIAQNNICKVILTTLGQVKGILNAIEED